MTLDNYLYKCQNNVMNNITIQYPFLSHEEKIKKYKHGISLCYGNLYTKCLKTNNIKECESIIDECNKNN